MFLTMSVKLSVITVFVCASFCVVSQGKYIGRKHEKNVDIKGFHQPHFTTGDHKFVPGNDWRKTQTEETHRCKGCGNALVNYIDTQPRRRRRDLPSVPSRTNGQFTQRSYGHFGHQNSNFGHYGHETTVTGSLEGRSQGGLQTVHEQQVSHTLGTRVRPSQANLQHMQHTSNVSPIQHQQFSPVPQFDGNLLNQQFGMQTRGNFPFQNSFNNGYELKLPLGPHSSSTHDSQGPYGIGGSHHSISTGFPRYHDGQNGFNVQVPVTHTVQKSTYTRQGYEPDLSRMHIAGLPSRNIDTQAVADYSSNFPQGTITQPRDHFTPFSIENANPYEKRGTSPEDPARINPSISSDGRNHFSSFQERRTSSSHIMPVQRASGAQAMNSYPHFSTSGNHNVQVQRGHVSRETPLHSSPGLYDHNIATDRHQILIGQPKLNPTFTDRHQTSASSLGFIRPDAPSETHFEDADRSPRVLNENRGVNSFNNPRDVTYNSRWLPSLTKSTIQGNSGAISGGFSTVTEMPFSAEGTMAPSPSRHGSSDVFEPLSQEHVPGIFHPPTHKDNIRHHPASKGLPHSEPNNISQVKKDISVSPNTLQEENKQTDTNLVQTPVNITTAGSNTASSQTQLQSGYEGAAGEASSAGRYNHHGSQTRVQGGFLGNGSFSAQAHSGFNGGITQSQVRAGNAGGSSASNASVEQLGLAQSQVHIGQPNGAAASHAEGRFLGGTTRVQARGDKAGGSASAHSLSKGLSSSAVQINVAGNEEHVPGGFHGAVSASVFGGSSKGQSNTELRGSYDSGRIYVGTAESRFDSSGSISSVPASNVSPGAARTNAVINENILFSPSKSEIDNRNTIIDGNNAADSNKVLDTNNDFHTRKVYPDHTEILIPSGRSSQPSTMIHNSAMRTRVSPQATILTGSHTGIFPQSSVSSSDHKSTIRSDYNPHILPSIDFPRLTSHPSTITNDGSKSDSDQNVGHQGQAIHPHGSSWNFRSNQEGAQSHHQPNMFTNGYNKIFQPDYRASIIPSSGIRAAHSQYDSTLPQNFGHGEILLPTIPAHQQHRGSSHGLYQPSLHSNDQHISRNQGRTFVQSDTIFGSGFPSGLLLSPAPRHGQSLLTGVPLPHPLNQTAQPLAYPNRSPGVMEPGLTSEASCCETLRSLRRRCCSSSVARDDGNTKSQCCPTSNVGRDFDGHDDRSGRREPCKVVKATCYIVNKPSGRARICQRAETKTC